MSDVPLLVLALLPLAVHRAWRLLGRDDITEPLWRRIPGTFGNGWRCSWCLATWMALGSTWLVHHYVVDLLTGRVLNRGGVVALVAAALADVVGLIGSIDDKLNE